MWRSESLVKLFELRLQGVLDKIIETNIPIVSVGVFGSYARDEYTLSSDIDICVIVDKLPERSIKGHLYEEAEMLKADLIFVTSDYFKTNTSRFANNLRRDYKEIYRC